MDSLSGLPNFRTAIQNIFARYKLGTTKRGEITFLVPQATPDKAFMGFRRLVRDQEVDGSNPFAPTNLLESATYKMRKSIERLVRGQDVTG